MKRFLCLFISVITILSCMWIPTFAAGKTLDTTSVEQDLESINLDVDRYIENLNGAKTALVLTRESGYTEGGIASLYIYIYVSDSAYNTSASYSDKLVFDLLKIKQVRSMKTVDL